MRRTAPTADELTRILNQQKNALPSRPETTFLILKIVWPANWDSKGRVKYEPHGGFTVTFNYLSQHESVSCSTASEAAEVCVEFIKDYFELEPGDQADICTTKKLHPA